MIIGIVLNVVVALITIAIVGGIGALLFKVFRYLLCALWKGIKLSTWIWPIAVIFVSTYMGWFVLIPVCVASIVYYVIRIMHRQNK